MIGSYGPSMTGTVLLGLWVLSQLISSCYTFTWDVKMDWGLLDKNAGENKFLREETVYRYRVRFLLVIMLYIFLVLPMLRIMIHYVIVFFGQGPAVSYS